MSDLPVTIRTLGDDVREMKFVRETTVKVRWPRRAGLSWNEWNSMHGPQVDALLGRASTTVAVSGGVVLGFLVAFPDKMSGKVVASLYVKWDFRGDGIGLRLLKDALIDPSKGAVRAWMPTAAWGRWCEHHGIAWERVEL